MGIINGAIEYQPDVNARQDKQQGDPFTNTGRGIINGPLLIASPDLDAVGAQLEASRQWTIARLRADPNINTELESTNVPMVGWPDWTPEQARRLFNAYAIDRNTPHGGGGDPAANFAQDSAARSSTDRDYNIPNSVADPAVARANFQAVAQGWLQDAQTKVAVQQAARDAVRFGRGGPTATGGPVWHTGESSKPDDAGARATRSFQDINDQKVAAGTYDRWKEIGAALADGRYSDASAHLGYSASAPAVAANQLLLNPPPTADQLRFQTDVGLAAGGPVLTGLASIARALGASDEDTNNIGVANANLAMAAGGIERPVRATGDIGARLNVQSSPIPGDTAPEGVNRWNSATGTVSNQDLPTRQMQNPVQQQQGQAPNYLPKTIKNAVTAIENGEGIPRIDRHTNAQTIFKGNESGSAWWSGALEFDVPGTENKQRILVKTLPDGTVVKGWVDRHDYNVVRRLPATAAPTLEE